MVLISFATLAQAQPEPTVARDQPADYPPEDKTIMRDYVLTADKFNAFIHGVRALATAKNVDDSLA